MKFVLFFLSIFSMAASQVSLQTLSADSNKNITVKALDSNKDVSTFYIAIQDSVAPHIHKTHTEIVQVISGEASFRLGAKEFLVKAGDYIFIPKNTVHSARVRSAEPLIVLSIQTPKFNGKDRHFTTH
jgi:quercetin dioxygenase-like cupin family protein